MRPVALLAGAGLLLTGAISTTASTASNTLPPVVTAGSHTLDVQGATAKRNHFTLSADGATITAARVTLLGDHTTKTVTARFGNATPTPCTLGLHDPTADTTPADCAGYSQPATQSATFTVAVT